jgi:hypothetical protein
MGFPPRVALTTEYRVSLLHRLNARLPGLDFVYASLCLTPLKKRAIRFFVFLFCSAHRTPAPENCNTRLRCMICANTVSAFSMA